MMNSNIKYQISNIKLIIWMLLLPGLLFAIYQSMYQKSVQAQGSCPTDKINFATYLVTGSASSWNFGVGNPSEKCWEMKNYPNSSGQFSVRQRYDYSYFWNNVRNKVTAVFTDGTLTSGLINDRCRDPIDDRQSVICRITPSGSTFTISSQVNVGANKYVVLFVGDETNSRPIDVIVDADVRVNDNGGLIIFASGNIKVKSTVKQLDGAWLADQKFIEPYDASVSGSKSAVQLVGTGYWWSFGGFDMATLSRSTTPDNVDPAEVVTFDAKYLVKFTSLIGAPAYTWQEVVP